MCFTSRKSVQIYCNSISDKCTTVFDTSSHSALSRIVQYTQLMKLTGTVIHSENELPPPREPVQDSHRILLQSYNYKHFKHVYKTTVEIIWLLESTKPLIQ